jgi:hypothetical protein
VSSAGLWVYVWVAEIGLGEVWLATYCVFLLLFSYKES